MQRRDVVSTVVAVAQALPELVLTVRLHCSRGLLSCHLQASQRLLSV